jgi:hypothetical protein
MLPRPPAPPPRPLPHPPLAPRIQRRSWIIRAKNKKKKKKIKKNIGHRRALRCGRHANCPWSLRANPLHLKCSAGQWASQAPSPRIGPTVSTRQGVALESELNKPPQTKQACGSVDECSSTKNGRMAPSARNVCSKEAKHLRTKGLSSHREAGPRPVGTIPRFTSALGRWLLGIRTAPETLAQLVDG